jgi:hypothetical protein
MSDLDDLIISTATNPMSITLPSATTVKSYYFQNFGSNTMTLQTVSSELINDSSNLILQFNQSSCRLISTGSKFLIF